MKKFLTYFLLLIPLCAGCSNGLNKTIDQELTDAELQRAMRKYTFLTVEKDRILGFRDWLCSNDMMKMQYDTLKYQTIIDYYTCCPPMAELEESYKKEYPNAEKYKKQADSILNELISIQPDSLVSLSFIKKTTSKTWLDETPIFHIKVSPLKGTVEQFDFEYYFSRKIDGETTIDDIPSSIVRRGYQNSPVKKETVIGYDGKLWTDIHANTSSEELLRDYNFIYKITNIRYEGRNWKDLPISVQYYIAGKPVFQRESAIEDIIPQFIDSNYKSFADYLVDTMGAIQREKYPTLSTLFFMYENQQ